MKTITYDLRLKAKDSSEYYQTIQQFSKAVFDKIARELGCEIDGLSNYIKETGVEKIRTEAEYAVEILTLGMTWKRYLGASQRTSKLTVNLLDYLYELRTNHQKIKPYLDKIRGWLTTLFIVPKIGKAPKNRETNFLNFDCLIKWLKATGEFKDESKRLKIWYRYFKSETDDDTLPSMETILEAFRWFKKEAKSALGKYTRDLETFLQKEYPKYKFREDIIFCGKEEVEYHLNMVGAEIMNWGFRPGYDKTNKKVVLVPACMRINHGHICKAKHDGLDITCTSCRKDCKINQLTQLGEKNNFRVLIVPHSSSFTKWLKKWENNKETGLVATACILNLVAGGYEMRELNIPAQCVLLDFCGCQKHWDKEGIETEINKEKLLELIN